MAVSDEREKGGRLLMRFNIENKDHRNKLACEVAFYIMETGYKNARKFIDIPIDYVSEGGFPLGKIWSELLEQFGQGKLSDEDIEFLIRLRMNFSDSPKKDMGKWMDRAKEAEKYYKAHKTLSMPNDTRFGNGMSMFRWVHHQKELYKRGELSLYQKKRMEEMGIQWIKPKKVTQWDTGYQYAEKFYSKNGHLFVNRKYITSDGFELGRWIQKQRDKYLGLTRGELTDDQIDMLEDIGMFWEDIENAEWDWFVGLLRECIRVTEKPFVIGKNYTYKNYALGEQVNKVIGQYADGSLSAEKERDLRKAGFLFNKIIK